nr:hypothetical protein [Tanacetum cinerariifolium]
MTDVTNPTGQAPTMAPLVRSNDQSLPRIRWVQTGYLKFSAKGTKREVFGRPIPGSLITADLQEASYYQEYLANMVKHRWFLGEYSAAVAVSGVSGAENHVHTPAPGESEALNGLPDLILSSEPKPLVQHRPHPPQSVSSSGVLSYPL